MKIVYLNCENLFLSSPEDPIKFPLEKSPEKARELARVLLDLEADVIWLIEVGGENSLKQFNQKYLNNLYDESLIVGNSNRGIELGVLVRKAHSFKIEHYTHKNRSIDFNYPHELAANAMAKKTNSPLPFESHKMSRDIGEVRLYRPNEKQPFLIVLCAHLKSQLDPQGIDPRGFLRREAEFKLLTKVVKGLEKHFNHQVPIIFGGDFNAQINDPELMDVKKLQHRELADILNLPHHDRITHVYFDKWDKRIEQQMDFCFVPPVLWPKIDQANSGIYRWRSREDGLLPLPQNQFQRYTLPSDHYPVVLSLKM